jgi:thiol-disulfide isomerase/thioredoxin
MPKENDRSAKRLWTPGRVVATVAVALAIAAGGYVLFSKGSESEASKSVAKVMLPGANAANLEHAVIPEDFELPTLDGRRIKLSDYRGKVLVVDFWATWCGPCRQEIPQLVRIANQNRDRGVEVVGLHIDDRGRSKPEAIRKFISDYDITYTVAMANDQMFTDYLGTEDDTIPQTLVFDRNGKVTAHFSGYRPSDARELELAVNRAVTSS